MYSTAHVSYEITWKEYVKIYCRVVSLIRNYTKKHDKYEVVTALLKMDSSGIYKALFSRNVFGFHGIMFVTKHVVCECTYVGDIYIVNMISKNGKLV